MSEVKMREIKRHVISETHSFTTYARGNYHHRIDVEVTPSGITVKTLFDANRKCTDLLEIDTLEAHGKLLEHIAKWSKVKCKALRKEARVPECKN